MSATGNGQWQSTACVLCSLNCGLKVQVEDNRIVNVRGDKDNPFSHGYTCSKGLQIAHYAHHRQRVLEPLKRQPDGSFAPIAWDRAFSEIAERLNGILAAHGPDAIGLVGGGGQGTALDVPYARGFMKLIGSPWWFHALAQEFTHKYWINRHIYGSDGTVYEADAEHTDCLLVIGTNPYMSHGLQRARVVLKDIQKDPNRTLIVVDPRRHETAKLADTFLQIRPGTDIYFLLAMLHTIVHEGLADEAALADLTTGWAEARALADLCTPEQAAALCDLRAEDIRGVARTFATARTACIRNDLGIYQNKFAAQNCYLLALLHAVTGNLCRKGGAIFPTTLFTGAGLGGGGGARPSTKVAGIPMILGMFTPNAVPEEVLEAGNNRLRALFVEASNPLRSYADSPAYTQAFEALDLLVCVDPAMTETARMAHYVLPPPVAYEKWETTIFGKGWPEVHAHIRPPVLEPPPEVRQECLIYYGLARAMGLEVAADPLFATLGQAIDAGDPAPVLTMVRGLCMAFAGGHYDLLLEAGTITADGDPIQQLFDHLTTHPEGAYLCTVPADDNRRMLRTPDKTVVLNAAPVLALFDDFELPTSTDFRLDPAFPLVLATGERSDYVANTIMRDPAWAKKHAVGYVRMHQIVAEEAGVSDGEVVRIVTAHGDALAPARVTDDIYPGNLSMPHGRGLLWENAETGELEPVGANVQALMSARHREPVAGVPYHKYIPCRLEKVGAANGF